MNQTLKVNEIFYSIQGEGGRAGEASIFIRLAGCNQSCDFCDTDHSKYKKMRLPDILGAINKYPCKWIVWTGGEPTLQLTDQIVIYFKEAGFKQAIETNGSNVTPLDIDYLACSPKVDTKQLERSFMFRCVDEFRYPIQQSITIPFIEELPKAKHYYVSPVSTIDSNLNEMNLHKAINHVKLNPKWKLSIQIHKLINIK